MCVRGVLINHLNHPHAGSRVEEKRNRRYTELLSFPFGLMNQFEFLIASTESARSDVLRYLRLLRDLDERIEQHLFWLRIISDHRQRTLSSSSSSPSLKAKASGAGETSSSALRSPRGRGGRGAGRGRGRGRGRGSSHAPSDSDGEDDGEDTLVGRKRARSSAESPSPPAASSSTGKGEADSADAPASLEALRAQFEYHKALALRHTEERETIAAELAVRARELLASADARIAQFESATDDLSSPLL